MCRDADCLDARQHAAPYALSYAGYRTGGHRVAGEVGAEAARLDDVPKMPRAADPENHTGWTNQLRRYLVALC